MVWWCRVDGDEVREVMPWENVERLCFTIARRIGRDGTLGADDLVQEAMLHLWTLYGAPTGCAAPHQLVSAVATRRMVDAIRKWSHYHRQSRQAPAVFNLEDVLNHPAVSESAAQIAERLDCAAAMETLTQRQRDALSLAVLGYSQRELCTTQGYNQVRAAQVIRRARTRLRRYVRE